MKYIIDLPDNCSWVQWVMTSDKDGHAYFDFKSPEDLTTLDKELDEAYKRGLDDGNTRNENGCIGCKYENERIDHAPCIYCCNAYSNQWMAKEKSDKIVVGDEVRNTLGLMNNAVGYFIEPTNNEYYRVLRHVDGRIDIVAWHKENCVKTGKHSDAVEQMAVVMRISKRWGFCNCFYCISFGDCCC